MKNKYLLTFVLGIFTGTAIVVGATVYFAPKLMLREQMSPYDLEKTVERITESAEKQGWVVSSVMSLDKSIEKHGGGEVLPVRLVNICQPQHAAKILGDDSSRVVSVMMPCTISVYEKQDGRVFVGTMNAGLLGRMFGGVVAEVMGGAVAREQRQFVDFAG
jgi:uncharacterized protein (DUF302 family)